MKKELQEKVMTIWNTFVLHWKTPPLGKYVSYRETIAYGIGGMGEQFIITFASLIALSATSFLVGNTIGIKPMHLQYMSVFSTFIGFVITVVRSYIIDNSHLKMGKFRPWLAIMGVPSVIIAIVFVWLPYETMSYNQKVSAVFICYNLLQAFYPFYQNSYTDLANVISPNSQERTDIVSVASVVYSLAPSLTGLFIPMLSKLTGGLNNIRTYRIIYPVIAVVGLVLTYVAVFGTKERLIIAKTHVTQFKFSDAFRAVAKNKYFWITSLAGWLGFLETAVGVIIGWTFIYGYPEKMGLYGLATTLIGNAALWAMLLCPFAIRTIGKRNLLILGNLANVVLIGCLYPLYHSISALLIIYYLNGFVSSFAIVYNPGINADMRDYQQYFTGERIDGMFGAVGIIGSFIGMFTGMVLPYVYQRLGLQDNYNVLEVASFRDDLFEVLIVAAAIGAFLNVVPYFFYDLTEVKQRGIIKVLKIRALFEDYGNGILKDEDLVEAIDIIDQAYSLYEKRGKMTTKDDILKAKRNSAVTVQEKQQRKTAVREKKKAYAEFEKNRKQTAKELMKTARRAPKNTPQEKLERKKRIQSARAERKAFKKLNEDISICDFVVDEMQKYDTLRMQIQLSRNLELAEKGYDGIRNAPSDLMKKAKALKKQTYEQRVIRSDAIAFARNMRNCHKNMKKYYPVQVTQPDKSAMERAQALPEDSFSERREKKKQLRHLLNEQSHYVRSTKILLDAQRMITEKENFTHLEDIRLRYQQAYERVEQEKSRKAQELRDLEMARQNDMEKRKAQRLARKGGNKCE